MVQFLTTLLRPTNRVLTECLMRTVSDGSFGPKRRQEIVHFSEVRRFVMACMKSVGMSMYASMTLADVLVDADYRGHFNHGLNRLGTYIDQVKSASCDANAIPVVLRETPATAWIDGKNALGPVVGNFCMNIAIQQANDVGVGLVIAKGSNHYGMPGYYSKAAAKRGLIGISMSNSSPLVAPTRGKKAAVGTNPITVAAPGGFILDMATSVVSLDKLELAYVKKESIPSGWALDEYGKATTNPAAGLPDSGGVLLPLGGEESHSGYKGYGLAVVVELFCGIFGGAAYGPKIPTDLSPTSPANLGQCFVAIDPFCFDPNWIYSLEDLLDLLRENEPIDPSNPIITAGDLEKAAMVRVSKQGGIAYHPELLIKADKIAEECGVAPMRNLEELAAMLKP